MEFVLAFFRIGYVVIFFTACYIIFRFEWGSEGKDERGQTIMNKSYGIVFPLLPLGWFLLFMYDDFISPIPYDMYKLLIWFLITGLMIIHAINISVLKRKF